MLKIRLGVVPLVEVNMPYPGVERAQVIPVWEDRGVVGCPRQAMVEKAVSWVAHWALPVGHQSHAVYVVYRECKGRAT